ncbi:MAG: InlB B-repeat-containing protein [Clostridia bacterium]|nr:InlB B-repeat-containing protein [Clostridia bacterium]
MALLTFCLVLTGIFFIAPIEAEAAVGSTFTMDNVTYMVLSESGEEGTVTVSGSTVSEQGAVTIPSSVTNGSVTYTVTAIGANAFYGNTYVTAIELPNTLTTIGANAFNGCTGITKVEIPASVTSINANAFANCTNLQEIRIYAKNITFASGSIIPNQGAYYCYSGSIAETFAQSNGATSITYVYDATCDLNGGTGTGVVTTVPIAAGETFSVSSLSNTASKTGYNLTKYVDQYGDGYLLMMVRNNITMKEGGLHFTAQWSPRVYNVELDPNGGEGDFVALTMTYDAEVPELDNHYPFRAGYTFAGYFGNQDGTGTMYYSQDLEPSATYNVAGSSVLYAKWIPNTYSVTYDLDGGTHEECVNFTATYGESYVLLPDTVPTKSGYTFVQWEYTYAMDGYTVIMDDEMIGQEAPFEFTEDLTFTAIWKERSPVRFEIASIEKEQEYFLNDPFDVFSGILYYDNGEYIRLIVYESDVTGFSTATIQKEPVTATVTKQGCTDTFTYTVGYDYANCAHTWVQNYAHEVQCQHCETRVLLLGNSKEYDGEPMVAELKVLNGEFDTSSLTIAYGTEDGQPPSGLGAHNALVMIGDGYIQNTLSIYSYYTAEFYFEDLNGEYVIDESMTARKQSLGYTDQMFNTPFGFVQQSYEPIPIEPDGSTVLKLYYDREVANVTLYPNGGAFENGESVQIQVKYGTPFWDAVQGVEIPERDRLSYKFLGWTLDGILITEDDERTMSLNGVELFASWQERVVVGIEIPEDKLVQWYSKLSTEKFREFEAFIRYADNSTEPITVTENMLTGFDLSVLTPLDEYCTATVNYKTFSADFTYYVRNISQIEYYVKLDEGYYESDVLDYYEGQTITLMDDDAFERMGYTFYGWSDNTNGGTYAAGEAYTLQSGDTVLDAVWKLNAPTLTSNVGDTLEFVYDGIARDVTITAEHELGNQVTYTYNWYKGNCNPILPPGAEQVWSLGDVIFEGQTYAFVNVSQCYDDLYKERGLYYYIEVIAAHGENTSKYVYTLYVNIEKGDQTITLSENEFTYSEGLTIDFADYVSGAGDGAISYAVSAQNGVTFDFANGVVSNITKAGGTFTLTVNKAASDNCNAATETFTVTLNKGAQTLSVSGTPSAPNWKEAFTVSVSGNKGALSYAITSGSASVDTNGVITANGAGQVRYSVTAAATDLYEAKTQEFSVTYAKAAGNLAPDYVAPSEQTICAESGDLYEVIAVPDGWYMNTIKMVQSGVLAVTATFTPSDTVNYDTYVEEFTVYVEEHAEGDEATCTTPQICTRCNTVLAEALGHDFSSSAWTDLGESGHAHQCSRCDVYDEIIPHYSEDEATCTTPKTCDSCGYVMEPSGDHSFTEEIADTAHLKEEASSCVSGATYWYDCAYCDEISDTLYFTAGAQGAHSFDGDGFCTLCDGVEAPYYNENRDINGDGTPDGAYEVSKVGHLYWFPSDFGEYIDGNVFLMNDIVVNENVLLEDGSLNASAVESFRIWKLLFGLGEDYVFDGNGKFISGLYLIDYDVSGFGVGGLLGENHGIIKNLTVKNSYLEGYEFSSIVYYNGGIVENCHSVNNTLVSKYGGGGVVGINYGNGTIKDCTNSSNLYVENGLDDETIEIFLGGIVAKNEGEVIIKNCVNYGTITSTANSSEYIIVGGIIGGNDYEGTVEITNCHNKGNIIVQSITPAVGGVVGFGVYNRISDCTNTGNITVDANYDEAVGGIIGVSSSSVTIERCYNAGDIEINAGSFGYSVAGIAGWTMTTTIVNSYNVGNIEVTFDENFDENNADIMATSGIANIETSLVGNCYNAGEIIIPAEYQSTLIYGGVIVLDDNDTSSLVENNYYLNATANEHGGRTAEQFASGEVAYALCKQIVIDEEFTIDGSAWGQTIGTDLTPVFDGDKVYAISHCANNATLYANDQSAVYILTKTDAKESTCQVQGNNAYWTCSICNKVYADENCTIVTSVEDSKLDLADHDWSATWDYEDEDGHAHKCLTPGCNEISTLEDHVEGAPATEDDPQLCIECGYVITPATGHVNHVSSGEYGYDENSHWFKCTGCNTYKIDQTAHQFDNACDVDCICGYQRTIEHNYTELKFNETHHWYVCSVCGSEKANSRVAHSGSTSDCQHKAECATCGQTYGDFGDHVYDTTKWVSIDNEHHAHECMLCDAYTDATDHYSADEATCTEDRLCDACGHKMADAHGHSYTKQIESPVYLKAEGEDCQSHHTYYYACEHCDASSKDDTDTFFEGVAVGAHKMSATWTTEYAEETNAGWHYHACTVDGCDYREDEGDCAGGENTCIALAICSTCQKAYGKYAEHSFGNTWEYKDATGHAHVCTVKGCNEHDEIMAHTPNIPAATEESAQYCTACQYQMAAQLNHTHSPATEWTSNATHHWKACGGCDEHLEEAPHSYDPNNSCDTTCEVCNAVREVSHDFTGEWEKDASGYWHVCAKNGCSVTDTKQNHESAGAATETDPEVCSICGWQIAPALGHTTHTPEAEWQKNETHHWHECTGCDDQELDKSAHNDGNNDGSCDTCGYAMSVTPPPHTHSHSSTWVTDANEHWNECECGDKANKAAHVDNNGDNKCDTCDYTMPAHDPDTPPVDNPPKDDNDGLGTGAIVGIAIGSVAVVGGGGFVLFWFVIRKKRR